MTVSEILEQSAFLFESRSREYGNAYKEFGALLRVLHPNGIHCGVEDLNRLGIYIQMLSKIQRFSKNFPGEGHMDSLDDLIVYTAMMIEMTNKEFQHVL